MRITEWSLVLVAVLALGCHRHSGQGQGTLARCGGSPSGFENVLAGADNEFFTARTRQSLKIKTGVDVRSKVDEKGNVVGLTMIARDSTTTINCSCPAGCGSDPGQGHGCVVVYTPNGPDATCSGDCVTEGGCCFGCGFMAPR
jgi:hypothetical protein